MDDRKATIPEYIAIITMACSAIVFIAVALVKNT